MTELDRRILALTDDGSDVSTRRVENVFRDEHHSFDEIVLAFAELLDAGLLVRSAPGRYCRAR